MVVMVRLTDARKCGVLETLQVHSLKPSRLVRIDLKFFFRFFNK